ncbi:MAG: preprotein translocase subunit SecG [Parvibaculum sp.]
MGYKPLRHLPDLFPAAPEPVKNGPQSTMTTVLLIIHLMVAVTLVALVLLQRSEGGALGIGGGGGGMMTGRGAGNLLTRATGVCAAIFFATSLTLVIIASRVNSGGSLLDNVEPAPAGMLTQPAVNVPAPIGSGLDQLKPQTTPETGADATTAPAEAPAVPAAAVPAAPAAPAAPAEPTVPKAQ